MMSHCGRRWSHFLSGDVGLQVNSPEMKWFLQVCIARLVALSQ